MKLAEIFDCLSTAILVFDDEDVCVYSNDACQELLVRSDRWLQGQSIASVFKANEELVSKCLIARKMQQSIVLRELDIPLPDWQRSLLLDINISPCPSLGPSALVLELVDRKDVSKLSQDSNTTAIFRAATRIVRGLCHEIKNPLGGIRGAAQLLSLETDSSETREYTTVITHEVDRLSSLLDRMSSGSGSFERSEIDVHQPIAQIAQLLNAEFGSEVEISFDFDTSLPRIEASLDSLKQALLNMIKNAAQWAVIGVVEGQNDGYRAGICLRTRAAYPDLRRSLMPEQGIQIQVRDNGPGVDPSIVDQLFLPMVSRREGGTGLGLSISQEIVQSHGGFIELDDADGMAGASFSIFLPYKQVQMEQK